MCACPGRHMCRPADPYMYGSEHRGACAPMPAGVYAGWNSDQRTLAVRRSISAIEV